MELFVDTAIVEEIKKAKELGIVKGVTTNPSLIAKSGRSVKDVINEITTLIDGPISAEVDESDAETMIKQGIEYSKMHKNIVIKLPLTQDGIKACKVLTENNIKTNVTLVFSPAQALLAMEAGATYVSPFLGRMDDAGFDAKKLIRNICEVRDYYGYSTQTIAASIRNVEHMNIAMLAGSDIATVPLKIIEKMYEHPLTTQGLKIFAADSKKK